MRNYKPLFLFALISIILLVLIESYGISQETSSSTLKNLKLSLSDEYLTVTTRNKTSFIATANNTGTEIVESVNISIKDISNEWISVIPQTKDIFPGETEKYLVVIDVPRGADTGVYKLGVKATDKVESNTETLTLIIGKDSKEVADMLLKEIERIKAEAERALLIKKCLDITVIKTFHEDAEVAFENGMKEYGNNNYEKAINWFKYAIQFEKQVVNKAEITIKTELEAFNSSRILIPPFYKSEEQFKLSENYLKEKNYDKICDPILNIRKFIIIGLIFWPGMVIFFVVLLILLFVIYKIKKQKERVMRLLKVKKRLEEPYQEES